MCQDLGTSVVQAKSAGRGVTCRSTSCRSPSRQRVAIRPRRRCRGASRRGEAVLRSRQVGGLVVLGSLDRLDEGDEVRRELTKAGCDDRAAALPVAAKPPEVLDDDAHVRPGIAPSSHARLAAVVEAHKGAPCGRWESPRVLIWFLSET